MGGRRQKTAAASSGFKIHWATWWVVLCTGALCVWQVVQLQHRWSAAALEQAEDEMYSAPSSVEAPALRALAAAKWSVPAESPFAMPQVTTGSESAASAVAPVSPLTSSQGGGGQQLAFSAEGPLDEAVKGNAAAIAVETSDDDAVELSAATGECTDVHPNADSPDMLHVVFASDTSQVEGVQASVASIVASTASPEELTVHIMVQKKWVKDFKERFGLRPECQGTVTVTGVLIRVHDVDSQLIERSVAKVSSSVLKQRGNIDSVENFARFYMHLVLERAIVIYLDADTIVQADLAQLRKQLLASGKTIGFVAREGTVKMDKFLKKPKNCDLRIPNYKKIFSMTAYNVGVFAVNLQRWAEQRVAERVEDLVSQHNACGGQLWIGGSQPPLLLAFLSRQTGTPEDFIVFDAAWNTGDLGWRTNLNVKKLRTKYVLHWNGNLKPWNSDGLYRELWLPHREKFNSLLRPYDTGAQPVAKDGAAQNQASSGSGGSKSSSGKAKKSTTTLSPEEVAAQAKCPSVRLLDDWTEEPGKPCKIGSTFGCHDGRAIMWAKEGCTGIFSVADKVTACGGKYSTPCKSGVLPQPSSSCGLMIMTSFFTTKKDWQRGKFAKVSFSKLQVLYRTVLQHGLRVTVIYDNLPEDFLKLYACDNFRFEKVNLEDYNKRYGVNDVRYFFFERLLSQHPEWTSAFVVDAFDVRVGMNPCPGMKDGLLYVGHEQDKLKKHPWMKARFQKMGGKYLQWYKSGVSATMKILNCGITGGRRDVMLKLFRRMIEVLQDPAIAIMQKKEDINLNMAALNYIVYNDFPGKFTGNPPVHSLYKRFQTKRKDVWFIHK